MGFRDRFNKKRNVIKKRHTEAVERKDEKTSSFQTIFDNSKIKNDVGFFKPGYGDKLIDLIPFEAGGFHPLNDNGEITDAKGEPSYVVDIYVHQRVGAVNKPFVCPTQNFGLPCPICEYIQNNRLGKKEWSAIVAKRRCVYFVWDHSIPIGENEAKGIQIWEVAHFFMQKVLDEIALNPRGGGVTPFADWEEGTSIAFKIEKSGKYTDANGTDRTSISYTGHRWVARDAPLPDDILDQTFPLDSIIKMHPTYEEIKTAFLGVKNESESEKLADGKEPEEVLEDDLPFNSELKAQEPKEEKPVEEEKPRRRLGRLRNKK